MTAKSLRHIDDLPDAALISVSTLAVLTGQGVSTVWRKLATDPSYPRPVKLGTRCTRVRLGDARKLLAALGGAPEPAENKGALK